MSFLFLSCNNPISFSFPNYRLPDEDIWLAFVYRNRIPWRRERSFTLQIVILPPRQGTEVVVTSWTDFVSPLSLNKDGPKQYTVLLLEIPKHSFPSQPKRINKCTRRKESPSLRMLE